MTTVEGELSYLSPESTTLRRFTAPGRSVNTGTYRTYLMPIQDGRPVRDRFTLDRNGFALVGHRSAVRDFTDPDEVDRAYPGEVAGFIKSYTGADRVATLSWRLRRTAAPAEHASQPQAALVHDDYSDTGARETASAAYATHFPDGPGYRRALFTSLWRVFSPPPQDWPLAICDYTSVGPDEGLDNRLYLVDTIPDDRYAEMPATTPGTSGSEFHHNPGHRWWYFPGMTRDEILFFKLNDSDHTVAWRVPHTAFRDPTVQTSTPRHSIEFRTVAYFE
ncbi:CmcJ/NvfI family oxidoreductase [Amycolatopsis alkalitolerans]|uniref:Methyltransferase n=1 Tax=Amycolatopsis alkalitolerans TaxID=2547244 RepID=A0A5C4LSJ3_9PSEU|nr:CmcJ/NvfI family oxidoreductase [Amycolatopsis alkalitolerans]TNC21536.1 hypothetical protein FG385_27875 [Amycolatopsis alkalitolerans]